MSKMIYFTNTSPLSVDPLNVILQFSKLKEDLLIYPATRIAPSLTMGSRL